MAVFSEMSVWIVISLPVLLLLPGHFGFSVAGRVCPAFAAWRVRELGALEDWFMKLVVSIALTSWTATVLAEIGYFHIESLIGSLAILCAILWGVSRRWPNPAADAPRASAGRGRRTLPGTLLVEGWPIGILMVAVCFASLPPMETIFWAGDSTVYVNTGKQISESGSFLFEDRFLDNIPPEARRELFANRIPGDLTGEYARFPGGLAIPDIAAGKVAAGFSPLFPVWIAVFHQLFGDTRALFSVAFFFGLLSVCAVFFAAQRLQGRLAGFFAGLLLAACMPQVWFMRFPTSETMAQFFVLGALVASFYYLESEQPVFATIAGLTFGVALLGKFDLMPLLTLVFVALAACLVLRGMEIANSGYFFAAFGILFVHAVVHLLVFPSNYDQYIGRTLRVLFNRRTVHTPIGDVAVGWILGIVGVLAVIGAALVTVRNRQRGRSPGRRFLGRSLAAVFVGGAVAYPLSTRSQLDMTLPWLGWYLSWALLVVFAMGMVGIVEARILRQLDRRFLLLVTLLVVASALYLYNPQDQEAGQHIWTMRRYLPVVIPLILVLLAASVVAITDRLRVGVSWAILVLSMLLFAVARPSMSIVGKPFWNGVVAAGRELAARLPENGVVLVGTDLAGTHLPTTLSYFYDRDSVLLHEQYSPPDLLESQIVTWLQAGREVFLLVGPADLHFQGPKLSLVQQPIPRLSLTVLETTTTGVPRQAIVQQAPLRAFRVRLRDDDQDAEVDVGTYTSDALVVLRGFYASEGTDNSPGGTFRWTGREAWVEIPRSDTVKLVLGAARPPGASPARVSIWIDERLVVRDQLLTADLAEIVLPNPVPAASSGTTVRIVATTFTPAELGLSDDARELGVMLYRIEYE